MASYFFDSSALVKRYINEVGRSWIRGILAPEAGNDIHVLLIAEAEVTSAIVRRRQGGTLSRASAAVALAQLRDELANEYLVLDVTDRVLAAAVSLVRTHELRAYDAVQLAGAVELNRVRTSAGLSAVTVVSADRELNTAAQAEGLAVEDPNSHP